MSGVNICWVVREGVGSGVGGYQPGVNVPLKALFLVCYSENSQVSSIFACSEHFCRRMFWL